MPLAHGAGVVRFDGDAQGTLVTLDGTGALSERAVGMARSAVAMPGGGTVIAEGGTLYTLDGRKLTEPLRITRRDESGSILWSTPIPTSIVAEPSDAQVYPNGAGHVMAVVAVDAFQVRVVWLDEQGRIASTGDTQGTFSSRAAIGPSLELPDGSLAFGISPAHSGSGWVVVHDLDPHLDVAPCWLDAEKGDAGVLHRRRAWLGRLPRHHLRRHRDANRAGDRDLQRGVLRLGRGLVRRSHAGSM